MAQRSKRLAIEKRLSPQQILDVLRIPWPAVDALAELLPNAVIAVYYSTVDPISTVEKPQSRLPTTVTKSQNLLAADTSWTWPGTRLSCIGRTAPQLHRSCILCAVARVADQSRLRGILPVQQVVGGHRFALQDGRHFEREIIVAGELERGVFARQLVGRAAAVAHAAGRCVRPLTRGRSGRRRGDHQVRLRGRERRGRVLRGRNLVGYRLAYRAHLVLSLQVLQQQKKMNTTYTGAARYRFSSQRNSNESSCRDLLQEGVDASVRRGAYYILFKDTMLLLRFASAPNRDDYIDG